MDSDGRYGGSLAPAISRDYERFAAVCAFGAAGCALIYAVALLFLGNAVVSSLLLATGALLSAAAVVAVYGRLRVTDEGFALLALLLGLAGALGAAVHGGYDLANALQGRPADPVPNPVDPRGLLTFGAAGIGTLIASWLILRSRVFPRGLGYLGLALGALLVVLYLATLLVANARSPLVAVPALLTGLVVNPAWYAWLGVTLWRESEDGGRGARA